MEQVADGSSVPCIHMFAVISVEPCLRYRLFQIKQPIAEPRRDSLSIRIDYAIYIQVRSS